MEKYEDGSGGVGTWRLRNYKSCYDEDTKIPTHLSPDNCPEGTWSYKKADGKPSHAEASIKVTCKDSESRMMSILRQPQKRISEQQDGNRMEHIESMVENMQSSQENMQNLLQGLLGRNISDRFLRHRSTVEERSVDRNVYVKPCGMYMGDNLEYPENSPFGWTGNTGNPEACKCLMVISIYNVLFSRGEINEQKLFQFFENHALCWPSITLRKRSTCT